MQLRPIVLLTIMLGGCGGEIEGSREAAPAVARPTVVSRVAPVTPRTDDLLSYLHLEFGEASGDPSALKASDLTFVGTLQFADRVEHVWKFPCASRTGCWLRVTRTPARQWMGWSVDPPPTSQG